MAKKVIFWSKFKEFKIVFRPSRYLFDAQGHGGYKAGKQLLFRNGYAHPSTGHVGSIYETVNADEIAFIQTTESFQSKDVVILDMPPENVGGTPVGVVTGSRSSKDLQPEAPTAPAEPQITPRAVRVPKRRGRVPA